MGVVHGIYWIKSLFELELKEGPARNNKLTEVSPSTPFWMRSE